MTFEIMTARVTAQPTVGTTQSRMAHSRTSNSSRNDDSSSGGSILVGLATDCAGISLTVLDRPAEISGRRRLQKAPSGVGGADSQASRAPSIPRSATEPRVGMMGRRRQSIRDQKAPGPGITEATAKRYLPCLLSAGLMPVTVHDADVLLV